MSLNPQVEALLAMFATAMPADYEALPVEALRQIYDTPMAFGEPPAVQRITDLTMDLPGRKLAARLYLPEGAASPAPLVLYFHGGGWVVGTLDTHDGTCRALARASGAAVLSVATSWPKMLADPWSGFNKPATIRNVVVFPAPFGPSKAWNSPAGTSRSR